MLSWDFDSARTLASCINFSKNESMWTYTQTLVGFSSNIRMSPIVVMATGLIFEDVVGANPCWGIRAKFLYSWDD